MKITAKLSIFWTASSTINVHLLHVRTLKWCNQGKFNTLQFVLTLMSVWRVVSSKKSVQAPILTATCVSWDLTKTVWWLNLPQPTALHHWTTSMSYPNSKSQSNQRSNMWCSPRKRRSFFNSSNNSSNNTSLKTLRILRRRNSWSQPNFKSRTYSLKSLHLRYWWKIRSKTRKLSTNTHNVTLLRQKALVSVRLEIHQQF